MVRRSPRKEGRADRAADFGYAVADLAGGLRPGPG